MPSLSLLWAAPEVNPITRKARSIPVLNVVDMHGRVFFFSWIGFFVAFWSWYAFPPLLHDTIQKDLNLTKIDVANSNIIALSATLLVRLIAGPCCDRFGPRWTFAGTLVIGAIPTFLAGTCYTRAQLFACRFFVGILGGSFVPCQVWSTGFFDKNVVGTANALIGGWGNAGGGVTYFLMPTIFNSLVEQQGYSAHVAWRITFIIPGVIITATALGLFFLCDDTPTGKWADRHVLAEKNLHAHGVHATIVDVPSATIHEKATYDVAPATEASTGSSSNSDKLAFEATSETKPPMFGDHEAHVSAQQMLDTARGEIIMQPTPMQMLRVITTPQVLMLALTYLFSFGGELAINSILGTYYQKQFKQLSQTTSGQWAAMFGLLNVITRPLGGVIADLIYNYIPTRNINHKIWAKKLWVHFLGIVAGGFLIAIGVLNPTHPATMFGLIAGFAFFLEGGNGANFALVPHVSPNANGVVSGLTGAVGNLGGIIFAIVFRYEGTSYHTAMMIIGIIGLAINVVMLPIPPVAKSQIGGR
ncbi:hypothetical protein DV735_g1153, partial [Chaetothyriales sp. CBS 134920]